MSFRRNWEMRRIVVTGPAHRCRPCVFVPTIRSANIDELQVIEGVPGTGMTASVLPGRGRSVGRKSAWPPTIPQIHIQLAASPGAGSPHAKPKPIADAG